MGKLQNVLLAVLMSAVTLAGCTEGGSEAVESEVVDPDSFELEIGKGAISGILVDDRFRPIDLEDKPENEFQTTGFILVQETGQQLQTNANGEFSVVDVDPGAYTLRVSAAGIEAAPVKANVDEGLFSEVSIQARRVAGEEDVILTQEHAAFASCFTNLVVFSIALDCTADQSGDTDRAAWYPNLSEFNESLHYVVAEILFDNDAPPSTAYDGVARRGSVGTDYSSFVLTDADGRYGKMHLPIGEVSPDEVPVGSGCDEKEDPDTYCAYTPDQQLQIIIFGRGFGYEQVRSTWEPANGVLVDNTPCEPVLCTNHATLRRGAGGAVGVQATYMLSLFLFDPEADPNAEPLHETDYCVLCNPDA